LDKSLFGPTLLLLACGCQAQNAGKRQEDAEKIGQKGFFCPNNEYEIYIRIGFSVKIVLLKGR